MRFGKKRGEIDKTQKTFFAWLPVTIELETRWLEKVTVRGRYLGTHFTGNIRWVNEEFIDYKVMEPHKPEPEENWENRQFEEQRDAMFESWQKKENIKHKNCEPHRWSYSEPKHCLDCGKRF